MLPSRTESPTALALLALALFFPGSARAQAVRTPAPPPTARPAIVALPQAAASRTHELVPILTADNRAGLKITKGAGVLPNEQGQVWREYDITPFTARAGDALKPEQVIVDWILRETGTDVWFSEPLGILSADSRTVRVYHTPAMQAVVRYVVERFVVNNGASQILGIRLVTIGSPNWRSRAIALLKPVEVKSPGVEAWLLSKENAAVLLADLRSRADFREHTSPNLQIENGQSQTLARTQPKTYPRSVRLTGVWPGYEILQGQIDEGFSLQISPLMSLDGSTCDAAIQCSIDQLEKLVTVGVEVPVGAQTQKAQIQVPQLVSWRLNERVRWPTDQVLVLSCGIVAAPAPGAAGGGLGLLNPFATASERCDALLFVEPKGRGSQSLATIPYPGAAAPAASVGGVNLNDRFNVLTIPNLSSAPNYRGRY
jgi:hypothetical protein